MKRSSLVINCYFLQEIVTFWPSSFREIGDLMVDILLIKAINRTLSYSVKKVCCETKSSFSFNILLSWYLLHCYWTFSWLLAQVTLTRKCEKLLTVRSIFVFTVSEGLPMNNNRFERHPSMVMVGKITPLKKEIISCSTHGPLPWHPITGTVVFRYLLAQHANKFCSGKRKDSQQIEEQSSTRERVLLEA